MVSARPKSLPWIAAAVLCVGHRSHATPIEYNPVTPCGDTVMLTPSHPAFGAAIASTELISPSIPEIPLEVLFGRAFVEARMSTTQVTGMVLADVHRARALEGKDSPDLQRLQAYFNEPLVRKVDQLPSKGSVEVTPWPGSYWPVYKDGINDRWDPNQPSPAEKYARAFGLNVEEFTRKVSSTNGILSQSGRRACSDDGECKGTDDSSSRCAKRLGSPRGVCIPAWFGICHAWAPAAMLEKEPRCPVTINDNVTFHVMDIKALLTQVYDGVSLSTIFTGTRFLGPDIAENNRDQYGRYRDPTRRDIGPGFFHIALGNLMGIRKQSFIVDVSSGSEVWNQPVKSYEVIASENLQPRDAAWRFYRTTIYPFNAEAKSLQFIKTRFRYVGEATEDGELVAKGAAEAHVVSVEYQYLLELDADGTIIGGEWVGPSQAEHPDFLWLPTAKPDVGATTAVGLSYQRVLDLLDMSLKGSC